MTQETAFNLTIIVIAITTVALIISEIRTNLLRDRARDLEQAEQEPVVADSTPYADVLNPPPSNG